MPKSLSGIWVSVILIMCFSLGLMAFAIQFIAQNNPTSPVLSDSTVNYTYNSLNGHLSDIQGSVQSIENNIQQDKGDPVMIFLILKSMLSLPWQMFSLITGGLSDVGVFVFSKVFGGSFLIFAGVINAIVIGVVIFLAVKFIRTGESER